MTPHARFLRSKIDHISANSKQNSKKALARDSLDQGVLFDEKKPRSKISWHCPFNMLKYPKTILIFYAAFHSEGKETYLQ
jgi:hypothetical protein